jgi:hypothetical protein
MTKYKFFKLPCYTFFVLIINTLIGCNPVCKDCVSTTPSSSEMFPAEVGRFTEYDVTEQEFALGRTPLTRNYQVKELMAEQYKDISGQTAYRIVRFKRNDDTQRWLADSTITLRVAIDQVVRNENGRDYIKLTFPMTEKTVWNGNLYNNGGDDKYECRNIGATYKIGTQSFPYSVTVVQQNDSTLVNQDKRIEVYAQNTGLIYKEKSIVQYCSSSPTCVGKNQIEFGIKQIVRFKKSGKE